MDDFLALQRYSFNRLAIERAPQLPGAYGIFDKNELIYVGSTGEGRGLTIRNCLGAHLDGEFGGCTADANRYCWEISDSPDGRAAEVRARFDAFYKRALRCQGAAR